MNLAIRQADLSDLDRVAPLFDLYRQFYGKTADLAGSRQFLFDRFRHFESTLFLALANESPAGFVQLYPSFSSVSAARIFILNDLFIHPAHRRKGLAKSLLEKAAEFGRTHGAVRLALSTATDNRSAQNLYSSLGWKQNTTFLHYELALS